MFSHCTQYLRTEALESVDNKFALSILTYVEAAKQTILIQVTSMSCAGVGLRIFRKRGDNYKVFVQFLKQGSTKFPAD